MKHSKTSVGAKLAARNAASAAASSAPISKRDNIASQSRDTREDRGIRQAKTAQRTQAANRGR